MSSPSLLKPTESVFSSRIFLKFSNKEVQKTFNADKLLTFCDFIFLIGCIGFGAVILVVSSRSDDKWLNLALFTVLLVYSAALVSYKLSKKIKYRIFTKRIVFACFYCSIKLISTFGVKVSSEESSVDYFELLFLASAICLLLDNHKPDHIAFTLGCVSGYLTSLFKIYNCSTQSILTLGLVEGIFCFLSYKSSKEAKTKHYRDVCEKSKMFSFMDYCQICCLEFNKRGQNVEFNKAAAKILGTGSKIEAQTSLKHLISKINAFTKNNTTIQNSDTLSKNFCETFSINKLRKLASSQVIREVGSLALSGPNIGSDSRFNVFVTVNQTNSYSLFLTKAEKPLKLRNSLKEDRTSNLGMAVAIAHDVKNALICLESAASQLVEELNTLTKENKDKLVHSINLVKYSQILLEDLKDKDMMETNKTKKAQLSQANLKEIVDFVISIFESKNQTYNKKIRFVSAAESVNFKVLTDEIMLKRILVNLVSNSYKFTRVGQIKVAVTQVGTKLVIEVKDSGIGMSKEEIDNLKEAYVRNESEANRTGWGIGMKIVRDLLKCLDAESFNVKSTLGLGTVISFAIPLIEVFDRSVTNPSNALKRILSDVSHKKNSFIGKSVMKPFNFSPSFPFKKEDTIKENSSFGKSTVKDYNGLYLNKDSINIQIGNTFVEMEASLNDQLTLRLEAIKNLNFNRESIKILIVDDNSEVAGYAKRMLDKHFEKSNFEIEFIVCGDGIECLFVMMLLNFEVEIVISDMNMEFMNGNLLEESIGRIAPRFKREVNFYFFSADEVSGSQSLSKPFTKDSCRAIEEYLKGI